MRCLEITKVWCLNSKSESGFAGWKDVQDLNMGKKMNSKRADSERINLENPLSRIIQIQTVSWKATTRNPVEALRDE